MPNNGLNIFLIYDFLISGSTKGDGGPIQSPPKPTSNLGSIPRHSIPRHSLCIHSHVHLSRFGINKVCTVI